MKLEYTYASSMLPQSFQPCTFADLPNLKSEKLQELQNILASILVSPAAESVYAQLIDGKPTWQSSADHPRSHHEAAINSDQSNPSNCAIQQYQSLRTSMESIMLLLKIDVNVYLSLNEFLGRYLRKYS